MTKNNWIGLFAAALGSLPPGPVTAASPATITWVTPAFPPATIRGGALKGQGYADAALAHVIGATPGFTHSRDPANLARFLKRAEDEDGICNSAVARSAERERSLLFSAPAYEVLGNRLITTTTHAGRLKEALNTRHQIDLATLSRFPDLVVGYSRSRSFGPAVDHFLKTATDRRQTYDVLNTGTAIRMLAAGRISYSFGSVVEASYFQAEDLPADSPALVSFTVESLPAIMKGYFACSRGPAGEAMIAAINALIPTPDYRASWQPAYERWLDENARADYHRALGRSAP